MSRFAPNFQAHTYWGQYSPVPVFLTNDRSPLILAFAKVNLIGLAGVEGEEEFTFEVVLPTDPTLKRRVKALPSTVNVGSTRVRKAALMHDAWG